MFKHWRLKRLRKRGKEEHITCSSLCDVYGSMQDVLIVVLVKTFCGYDKYSRDTFLRRQIETSRNLIVHYSPNARIRTEKYVSPVESFKMGMHYD